MTALKLALADDPDFRLTHRWWALLADVLIYALVFAFLAAGVWGLLVAFGGPRL